MVFLFSPLTTFILITKMSIFYRLVYVFKVFFQYLYIMKLQLTEKQFKKIISELNQSTEIEEQEEVSSEPTAGTSSTQSGGTGYPEVGKWETGLTRGPANQVGVTKWSDIVGVNLKRGKSNQLK
jgi:hypothetical protein